MIAVINYGAGNLPNAVRALEYVQAPIEVVTDPAAVLAADAVVLPGVGATADTMRSLREMGMDSAIRAVIARGTPFLGICVGMQVLAEQSEEFGLHECLGLVPGTIRRFDQGLKVPQIGWNSVQHDGSALWEGIPNGAEFYFVHSYYLATNDAALVAGRTEYGLTFPAAIARDNITAVQFHPEKSGQWGLKLLGNWVELARGRALGIRDRD
ncbi:imidazole glycerol phosphate synthase subunit HisH [Herpetosiphon geysericola]|uniref:Imidazole glycerol phosphate synthase subunit HisH n=1 Tax=Herpetosiphon geysericola TaxID=70996 RepID=A0A0P6XYP8_9CHLR|nr:imidazole glycerol phosphate synthase subunit HisH [Herpetosiphon geysericola]KPL81454.1 imidazole glycerol phosphate synthase [Herpetosiphon geysericola]